MLKGQSPYRGDNFLEWLEPRIKREMAGYDTPCWLWSLSKTKGYARWRLPAKLREAENENLHRSAYRHLVGPIPDGLVIDHLCRNRACLNPSHLEPVTGAENTRRGINQFARRTHCSKGHEYTPENTAVRQKTKRRCRICSREKTSAWKERQRRAAGKACCVCSAALNHTNVSGYCWRCVNARFAAAPCEDAALRAKVVPLRGVAA